MTMIIGTIDEDGNCSIMAEVKNRFSHVPRTIVQADLASITYTVFDGGGTPVSGHHAAVASIASLIIDTPITADIDPSWTLGGDGYNFCHDLAASAFPTGDTVYRYEALLTYTDGRVGWVRAQLTAENILTS